MFIYDLTPLTRQANAERRVAWQGFEMARRHFYLLIACTIFALPVTGILYAAMGVYGVLPMLAICYGLPFALIETRTSDGLRQRRIHALYDKRRSNTGSFIVCNREIFPAQKRLRVLRAASIPVDDHRTATDAELPATPSNDVDSLFAV